MHSKRSLLGLFLDKVLYPLLPHVFGYKYFVQNLSPGSYKLSAHSIKYVLVGYLCTQKGYRCYHPVFRKYFTSIDIMFSSIFLIYLTITYQKLHASLILLIVPSVGVNIKPQPPQLQVCSRHPKVPTPILHSSNLPSPIVGPSH